MRKPAATRLLVRSSASKPKAAAKQLPKPILAPEPSPVVVEDKTEAAREKLSEAFADIELIGSGQHANEAIAAAKPVTLLKDFPNGNVSDIKPRNLFGGEPYKNDWWPEEKKA